MASYIGIVTGYSVEATVFVASSFADAEVVAACGDCADSVADEGSV